MTRRPFRFALGALAAALLGGCEGPPPEPDAASAGAERTAPVEPARAFFDPGAVEPGDSVAGLAVVSKDVQRVFEDSVWAGGVAFQGEMILQGVYQPHFDWPEVTALCFHVTDAASSARVPAFEPDGWSGDGMKTWFCFDNPELALELLGPPDPPRELVVAVDDYRLWRVFSDGYSTARLTELLEAGPEATFTLREP